MLDRPPPGSLQDIRSTEYAARNSHATLRKRSQVQRSKTADNSNCGCKERELSNRKLFVFLIFSVKVSMRQAARGQPGSSDRLAAVLPKKCFNLSQGHTISRGSSRPTTDALNSRHAPLATAQPFTANYRCNSTPATRLWQLLRCQQQHHHTTSCRLHFAVPMRRNT